MGDCCGDMHRIFRPQMAPMVLERRSRLLDRSCCCRRRLAAWPAVRIPLRSGGFVSSTEAAVVVGVLLPGLLFGYLFVLEHSEWVFMQRVAPSSRLCYTPTLHKV